MSAFDPKRTFGGRVILTNREQKSPEQLNANQ
jgi:hypothetical protein